VRDALAKRPEDRPSSATLLLRLLGGSHDDQQAALVAGASAAAGMHPPGEVPTVPALGELATAAYEALAPALQAIAREVWLRMVVPGSAPDGSQDSVRTVSENEFLAGRSESEQLAVHDVIAAFADAGVLVHEPIRVSPASLAVLRAWPRLREWVEADRQGLRIHRRVGEGARAWEKHGRRSDDLEHGTALRSALNWSATAPSHLRLNLLEREFLDASRAADTRRGRQRRALVTGTAVLMVLALLAGAIAWQQNRANERQSTLAEARRLASVATSLRLTDPVTAMRLSVAAWRLADVTETRSALVGAMTQKEADSFSAPSNKNGLRPQLTSGGRTLVTYDNNRVVMWDVAGHRRADSLTVPAMENSDSGVVSADGRTLAAPTWQNGGLATQVWHLLEHRRMGKPLGGGWDIDRGFSPSGRLLMVSGVESEEGTFRLWDVNGQRPVFEIQRPGGVVEAAVSPDDRLVALYPYGGPLEIWDVKRQERLPTGWAPRSQQTQNQSYTWRWDISSGKELPRLQHDSVGDADFSEDGRFLVTAGSDEILLWRLAASSRPVWRYPLTGESPDQVKIDVAARKIRYLTYDEPDASVRSLDLGHALDPAWRSTAVQDARFSMDSHLLGVTWNKQRTARFELRDGHSGKLRTNFPEVPLPFFRDQQGTWSTEPHTVAMSFSLDGDLFAYGVLGEDWSGSSSRNRVTVWDTSQQRMTALLRLSSSDDDSFDGVMPEGIALSPDGKRLVVSGPMGTEIWDVRRRVKLKTLQNVDGSGDGEEEPALRPDGRMLVNSDEVDELPSGEKIRQGPGDDTTAIVFSSNGRYLAIGNYAGRVTLWGDNGHRRLSVLPGTCAGPRRGATAVSALAFSPNGRTLAVGCEDGTVQLWDVASSQLLGSELPTPGDKILSLAFNADGHTLYTAGAHVLHQRYALDTQHMAEAVCKRAGGNLPRSDWRTYIPQAPYQKTC
jgi:WD40 repeat protein